MGSKKDFEKEMKTVMKMGSKMEFGKVNVLLESY
jgi:hypothetical protein